MGEALSEAELATVRSRVQALVAILDAMAARLAAAEKVVEAARDADLKARAAVLDDDGWHPFAAHLRRIGMAIDAYDALSAPSTDRGADG